MQNRMCATCVPPREALCKPLTCIYVYIYP